MSLFNRRSAFALQNSRHIGNWKYITPVNFLTILASNRSVNTLMLKSIASSLCYILLYWLNLTYEFADWLQANSTFAVTVTVTVRRR